MTDQEVVAALGGPPVIAPALSISLDAARKFSKRGIPWRYRPAVQKLAKAKRIKLPPDFLEHQRAA